VRISVELDFSFKRALGEGYRTLEPADGATVREGIRALTRRYPEVAARLLDEAGKIRRNIHALVNGGNVQFRERFDTLLEDGDRLSILAPVGGG